MAGGKFLYQVVLVGTADLNVIEQVHALERVVGEEHVEQNDC